MATAKKTASGKWWARGYNKYFDAYKSFTKSTKREAERAAREYSLLVPTDDEITDVVSKIDDPSVTLQEAAKEYAENRCNALSPSTMKKYKMMTQSALGALGTHPNGAKTPYFTSFLRKFTYKFTYCSGFVT